LNLETVGSDSSSATQGSSTLSVAGRKRAPTKQCADALAGSRKATAASAACEVFSDLIGKWCDSGVFYGNLVEGLETVDDPE